jgi:hypothetical protein
VSTVLGRAAYGCIFCQALRELLTFDNDQDRVRRDTVWREGGCYFTANGMPYDRVEAGEDFSLFHLIDAKTGRPDADVTPMWFRNGDMVVEGSNRVARIETPMAGVN